MKGGEDSGPVDDSLAQDLHLTPDNSEDEARDDQYESEWSFSVCAQLGPTHHPASLSTRINAFGNLLKCSRSCYLEVYGDALPSAIGCWYIFEMYHIVTSMQS